MDRSIIIIVIFYFSFYSWRHSVQEIRANIHITSYEDPDIMIDEGKTLIKEGDLVVRLNSDPSSQYLKEFNRHDKKYSHAGIVLFEKGRPFIYHLINGEENPDAKLKKDSLSRFCDPRKNMAYGIFRYDMSKEEIANLRNLIQQWYKMGTGFDSTFNLKTDEQMYCSEMISKSLTRATNKRIQIETTKPTNREAIFFSRYMHLSYAYTSKLEIVAIDNLYTNPYCHLIKEYTY